MNRHERISLRRQDRLTRGRHEIEVIRGTRIGKYCRLRSMPPDHSPGRSSVCCQIQEEKTHRLFTTASHRGLLKGTSTGAKSGLGYSVTVCARAVAHPEGHSKRPPVS